MITLSTVREVVVSRVGLRPVLLGGAASVILLGALLVLVDAGEVVARLRRAEPGGLALAAGAAVLVYLAVAARVALTVGAQAVRPFLGALDVTFVHAVLLVFLPARLGDVCYPLLLRRSLDLDLVSGAANLVVLRVYDVVCAVGLFLAALALARPGDPDSGLRQIAWGVLAVVVVALLLAGLVARWSRGRGPASGRLRLVADLLGRFRTAVSAYRARDHAVLLALTLVRWLLAAGLLLALFRALSHDISPAGALFVAMGLNFAAAFPLQTIGGFGLIESAMAFLLGVLGTPLERAIALALAARLLWLLLIFVLSALWLAARLFVLRDAGPAPQTPGEPGAS